MAGLTDAAIRAAKPGEADRDLADGTVPGLTLRVFKSGRKAFSLRLRTPAGQKRLDVGEYPATTLADARGIALEARRLAGRGQDPFHAIRPPAPPAPTTVKQAIARWLETKAGNRSLAQEKRRMELHVEPAIGNHDIQAVTRAELHDLLHAMAYGPKPRPVEANRTFTSLRGFFGWCAAADLRSDDPTALLPRPVKVEPSRRREKEGGVVVLGMDDLARLWKAAPGIKSAVLGDLLRCMLLVPLRRDEWTDLRWSEVRESATADGWRGAALSIGADRMKGRRPALVPLSPAAAAILTERKNLTGGGAHVFAIPGRDSPFAGWRRAANTLRALLPGRADWSPHTIRKSVATALVRDLGADELLVGRILQHSPSRVLGVTAVYQRSERLAEQAALLARWAEHIEAVAAKVAQAPDSGAMPVVVPMVKRRKKA